ncbi:MAG: FAD binding domain-containing protein [Frankia sp.]
MTGVATMRRPRSLTEAIDTLAASPGADLLAGGTDLVPALRTGARPVREMISLRRIVELRARGAAGDWLTIGACATYADLAGWSLAPGLAATARSVGSPQIRNTGTVGGALGTASPRGDLLTFLVAADAGVVVAGPAGQRQVGIGRFLADRHRPDELVTAVKLARPCGPQTYLKIGARQTASIPVASCALVVDRVRRLVRCAIGGVASRPVRAVAAEDHATAAADWSTGALPPDAAQRFGDLVVEAVTTAPDVAGDDVYAPAAYRSHAAGVLARRASARCLAGTPRPDARRW